MASYEVEYFLGANSPSGFYSMYDQMIDPAKARGIYILKGGPGCGKSTLMRRVGARAKELGQEVEYILCSGDPDSLDGVILPGMGVAVVDGTAPHVMEPAYPGAVERYVDLGACCRKEIRGERQNIIQVTRDYKAGYRSAYRCLGAAGQVLEELRAAVTDREMEEKLARRARGILAREVPRRRGAAPGQEKKRFLTAVTHRGRVALYGTALAQCGRVYELSDRCGLGHGLLLTLRDGVLEAGYDAVACPDPMAPERLAHLIVPELGLAFVTTAPGMTLPEKAVRRLRMEGAVDSETMRTARGRVRFARKMADALVDEGIRDLARTKAKHDELEKLYRPYIDFDLVQEKAAQVMEDIFEG